MYWLQYDLLEIEIENYQNIVSGENNVGVNYCRFVMFSNCFLAVNKWNIIMPMSLDVTSGQCGLEYLR